jgi:hypothetical protein
LQFLNECTEESNKNIKKQKIYEVFKEWFKNNNPNAKIPCDKIFYTGIKKYKTIEKVYYEKNSVWCIKQ